MSIDRVKAHIDFISSDTFRVTTLYRQKNFKAENGLVVDLESLSKFNGNTAPDFYVAISEQEADELGRKFLYEVIAKTSGTGKTIIDQFWHHEPKTIEVKIVR